MKLDRTIMKNLAISAMKKMGILGSFIQSFEKKNIVTMFINGYGYYIDENTEDNLLEKIKQVEAENGGVVYAVIKGRLYGETIYSMLYVGSSKSDNENHEVVEGPFCDIEGRTMLETFAYVYNASYDYNSEFGYIGIQPLYGGLRRVC